MYRHFTVYGLAFAGLAGFALFAGWTFFDAASLADGWRTLAASWRYVAAGIVLLAGLAGFLAALAFYSATRGFDDRVDADLSPPKS